MCECGLWRSTYALQRSFMSSGQTRILPVIKSSRSCCHSLLLFPREIETEALQSVQKGENARALRSSTSVHIKEVNSTFLVVVPEMLYSYANL